MMLNNNRLHTQYKHLYRKINKYIKTGKWYKFTQYKRNKLLTRLDQLAIQLKSIGVKVASAAGFGALMASPGQADAQAVPMSDVTLQDCNWTAGIYSRYDKSSVALGDIDDDGDLDLVINEYYGYNLLRFFENQGDPTTPNFVEQLGVNNPFLYCYAIYGGFDNFTPELADLDGDGDLDLVVGDNAGFVYFAENAGTQASPDFSAGFTGGFYAYSIYEANPACADIDDDGDQDLFIGGKYFYTLGWIEHFENNGGGSFSYVPYFASPTGSIYIDEGYVASSFADLDCDGDQDLAIGTEYAYTYMFENTGTAASAVFQQNTGGDNPFDGITTPRFNHDPEFGDLDGDGDFDALNGDFYGNVYCIENTTDNKVAPIPTMGEWGILITGLMVSILGILGIRRREDGSFTFGKVPMILLLAAFTLPLNAQKVTSGKFLTLSVSMDKTDKFQTEMDGQLQDLFDNHNLTVIRRVQATDASRSYQFMIEYDDNDNLKPFFNSLNNREFRKSIGIKSLAPRFFIQAYGQEISNPNNTLMVSYYRLETDFDTWFATIDPEQFSGNGVRVISISTLKRGDHKVAAFHYEITDMDAARASMESPTMKASMKSLGMTPASRKMGRIGTSI